MDFKLSAHTHDMLKERNIPEEKVVTAFFDRRARRQECD